MNCCDEYGDCRQGRDCPARTGRRVEYSGEVNGGANQDEHFDDRWDMVYMVVACVVLAFVAGVAIGLLGSVA
jgi:hypothetical protein